MNKIPILRNGDVTLYGVVVNNSGKLGRYQVYSPFSEQNGIVFYSFAEAESKYNYLVKVCEKQSQPK